MSRVLEWLKDHRRTRHWLIGVASAIVLYTLLGFFILPWIARSVLQAKLTESLGRAATVEKVRFNPYTLVLEVEGLSVAEEDPSRRFLGFDLLHVNLSLSSLFRLALVIEDLRLIKPFVRIEQRADGRFNFSDIQDRLARAPAAPPEESAPDDKKGQPVILYNLQIRGGAFEFVDRQKDTRHTLDEFDLVLPLVSVREQERDEFIQPAVRARFNGKRLELNGRSKPFQDTLESEFDFTLAALDLVPLWAYVPLQPRLAAGTFSCAVKLTFRQAERPELLLSGTLSVDGFTLVGTGGEPLLAFESLSAEIERFDVFGGQLSLGTVRWNRPRIPVVLDAQGGITALRYLPPGGEEKPQKKSTPFRVTARSVVLSDGTIPFEDRRLAPSFGKELSPIRLSVSGFDNTGGEAAYELRVGEGRPEHLELDGRISLAPKLILSGKLSLQGVAVPAYAAYLKELPVVIDSATLGVGTEFSLVQESGTPIALVTRNGWLQLVDAALAHPASGARLRWERFELREAAFALAEQNAAIGNVEWKGLRFSLPRRGGAAPGQAGLARLALAGAQLELSPLRLAVRSLDLLRFSLSEKTGSEPVVTFAALGLRGIAYQAAPAQCSVGSLFLQEPSANLTLEKEVGLNLSRALLGPPPPSAPAEQEKPPAEATAVSPPPDPNGPGMAIALPRIALHKGVVRFADRTLDPPFVGKLADLEVDVVGFSNRPGTRATLTASADAGAQGAIEITGAANPNDSGLNPSLQLRIRNTDVTTFSPYTLRYVSYPVATGKLDLQVDMAISDRKLTGENKLRLTNFTLGEEHESPDDVGIPLGLALVLLRDSDNNIELDIPVSGSLDDPDFALGKVIWRAVVNVLTKIVTSPFRFLAGLVGGGEDIDRIAMEPGQAQIPAEASGKVEALIAALKKRPGVRLAIAAITDTAADGAALTRARVELALRRHKASTLPAAAREADSVETLAILPAERPGLVDAVARAAGWKPPAEPRSPEALYAEQEQFLRTSLAAGSEELRELGAARSAAVLRALQADPAVLPERLFLRQAGDPERKKAGDMKHGVVIDIQ
ncbi:MAG: DUF748 domain-containing protein [Myxococcales bacterium]|nr:DUF748 domain-containing protein [Myxococcales bacterium]